MSGTAGIPVMHGREDVNNLAIHAQSLGLPGSRNCTSRALRAARAD
jgi:hypothetical protein